MEDEYKSLMKAMRNDKIWEIVDCVKTSKHKQSGNGKTPVTFGQTKIIRDNGVEKEVSTCPELMCEEEMFSK